MQDQGQIQGWGQGQGRAQGQGKGLPWGQRAWDLPWEALCLAWPRTGSRISMAASHQGQA